ncbi:uncharacterized protein EAF02_011271 [Botrytis sinoallii]|uniref:uncharacterized protein n=1 Tax=Botrytis sinoallii TaxID=1463999 RepID=UPI00190129A7|nr:uncharacterized protein EAF02_011271 [Botrytis sinoallii]KAF7857038.1 hypothetical protein EAF02_011271 [Botrytis sinoallii]
MRTTIEPHLMSILNNDASEAITNSPSLELPPLHDRNILQTSHRPLILEHNAGTRSSEPSSQVSQHSSSIAPLDDNEVNYRDSEEGLRIGNAGIGKDISAIERTLGSSSPQSLRKILDDNTGTARPLHPKKQQHRENGSDENEGGFKTDGVIVATTQEVLGPESQYEEKEKRRKDEEKVVRRRDEQPAAWSGVDLKDRFRTCCPEELRAGSRNSGNYHTGTKAESAKAQSKTELVTFDPLTGNFMTGEDQEADETCQLWL